MNFFKKFPSASILIAGSSWGLTGLFVRNMAKLGFSDYDMIFFRSVITAISIGLFLLFTDKKQLKIDIKDSWMFIGTGIVSFTAMGLTYYYTINHASMSVAAILLYTAPFFVMLLARVFFKEKITLPKIMALLLAALGCVMICGTETNTTLVPLTVIIGLLSGLTYGLYSIFGPVALKKYSSWTVTAYTFIFGSITCVFLADLPKIGHIISEKPVSISLIILFTLFTSIIPYIFYTNGLKYTEAGKASIMATIETVVASLSGIIVFHESITIFGVLGIVSVISAVVLLNLKKPALK